MEETQRASAYLHLDMRSFVDTQFSLQHSVNTISRNQNLPFYCTHAMFVSPLWTFEQDFENLG